MPVCSRSAAHAGSNAWWSKRGNSPNVGELGQGVLIKVPGVPLPWPRRATVSPVEQLRGALFVGWLQSLASRPSGDASEPALTLARYGEADPVQRRASSLLPCGEVRSIVCARGVICSQALSARPMQPHEGWSPEPDPGERERQRQRTLTIRLLLVIAVLLGAITPMLLWWLLS